MATTTTPISDKQEAVARLRRAARNLGLRGYLPEEEVEAAVEGLATLHNPWAGRPEKAQREAVKTAATAARFLRILSEEERGHIIRSLNGGA